MLTTCMTARLTSLCKWRQHYHFSSSQPISSFKKIQLQPRLPSMLVSLNEAYSACQRGRCNGLCLCTCTFSSIMVKSVFLSVYSTDKIPICSGLKAVHWFHCVCTYCAQSGCVFRALVYTNHTASWLGGKMAPGVKTNITASRDMKSEAIDLFYFPSVSPA